MMERCKNLSLAAKDEAIPKMQPKDALKNAVRQVVFAAHSRQWATSGAEFGFGVPWKRLAPATINARKAAGIDGEKPLEATGQLKQDMAQAIHHGQIRGNTLTIDAVSMHGTGYGRGRHKLPPGDAVRTMQQGVPDLNIPSRWLYVPGTGLPLSWVQNVFMSAWTRADGVFNGVPLQSYSLAATSFG